ncbi:MAG: class B sortase [Ruminococcus sp.]|nr:class B sortase [Ruminococcus sp.]
MSNKGKAAKIISAFGVLLIAAGLGGLAYTHLPSDNSVPVASIEPEPTTIITEIPTEPPEESVALPVYSDYIQSGTGMTEKAKMLLKQNKDIAGWLRIKNTNVDYPVLKDPGEVTPDMSYYGGISCPANDYYLHRDLDGSYKFAGTLYMDYRDNFGGAESEQSENIIIYGHNMANNTMFGSIRRYRQDEGFFEQSPFIEFSSNYKDYDYVICACLITGGNWYSDFIYWDMEELDTEEDFNYYMRNVKEKQLYDWGVDVKYGDKLLTLSTCYADEDNSRFLIIARRLRDGESAEDFSTIERTAEYKAAHKQ